MDFDFKLPESLETNLSEFLNNDQNIIDFNKTYLLNEKYSLLGYFELVKIENLSKSIVKAKKSKKSKVIFFVRHIIPGQLIPPKLSEFVLNMYILSWKTKKQQQIQKIIVVNLSANSNFPNEQTVFSEENLIKEKYGITVKEPLIKTEYIKYEDVFSTSTDKRVQVLFFGLWYSELIIKGFTTGQIKIMKNLVGMDNFQNFLRTRYILPITKPKK